jgi:hypothetical protein
LLFPLIERVETAKRLLRYDFVDLGGCLIFVASRTLSSKEGTLSSKFLLEAKNNFKFALEYKP